MIEKKLSLFSNNNVSQINLMEANEVKKFGVVIFESLPDNEKKNGRILHDEVLKYKKFQEQNLTVEFFDVQNKSELFKFLTALIDEAINSDHFYLLHFEMHGFYGGIEMKNNEKVYWNELFPLFQKLNTFYRNYLTIYLAVCEGASLLKYIEPDQRSPFRTIIGSIKKIKSHDLLIGFEKFYDHFFFTFDIPESLNKYNQTIENKASELKMITCEYCFDMLCDFKRKTADKSKSMSLIIESLNIRIPMFKYLALKEQERFIEKEYEYIESKCKSNRDYFLMNDIRTSAIDKKI